MCKSLLCCIFILDSDENNEALTLQDFINGEQIDIANQIPEGEDPLNEAMESEIKFENLTESGLERTSVDRRQVDGTKWPKTGGKVLIPYTIRLSDFNTYERANIAEAITQFKRHTCVRYRYHVLEN